MLFCLAFQMENEFATYDEIDGWTDLSLVGIWIEVN